MMIPENTELEHFLKREEEIKEKLKIKNKPIITMTYLMVLVFLALFAHLIYFMVHDSKKLIADSHNSRQDYYAKYIRRGDIVSADGEVLATTTVDEDGNETREYPYKEVFAHVIGYNEYGRSGIELQYNFQLLTSNVNVVKQLKNDVKNNKNPGDTVCTTLDSRLQQAAYDALGDAQGAVVVLDPSTGKILAFVSKPSYDPNNIEEVWDYIHSEEGSESTIMLNRASQGLYAPGSTFKIVTALEYIRENPNYKNYSYECEGTDIFKGVEISCANDHVHGTVDLKDSVAYSCNTSFANIGLTLDKESYRKAAEDLLYNKDLPVDIDHSNSSFKIDKNSDDSIIPQTAIGQGDTAITPLHNAMIMSAIANGSKEDTIASLRDGIKKAFGSSVTVSDDGEITAKAGQTLSFSGDSDAIGIASGTSTRLTTSMKLSDFGASENKLTINGKEFEFDENATIADMIKQVNASDAGVKMSYNSLSDSFTLESTSTGEGFDIEVGGGLADTFFSNVTKTEGQNAIVNIDGVTVEKMKSPGTMTLMSAKESAILIEMLEAVCDYGTAESYFEYKDYDVAGKTGTAEYDNNGNCNSWFVGFSGGEDPDIVVSVIVEDYTENQTSGSYVAMCVFDAYYDK